MRSSIHNSSKIKVSFQVSRLFFAIIIFGSYQHFVIHFLSLRHSYLIFPECPTITVAIWGSLFHDILMCIVPRSSTINRNFNFSCLRACFTVSMGPATDFNEFLVLRNGYLFILTGISYGGINYLEVVRDIVIPINF